MRKLICRSQSHKLHLIVILFWGKNIIKWQNRQNCSIFNEKEFNVFDARVHTMELDEPSKEPAGSLDLKSESLYELVYRRFEDTLDTFDDGFPAAFDSLSKDVLDLLAKLRKFLLRCFQR